MTRTKTTNALARTLGTHKQATCASWLQKWTQCFVNTQPTREWCTATLTRVARLANLQLCLIQIQSLTCTQRLPWTATKATSKNAMSLPTSVFWTYTMLNHLLVDSSSISSKIRQRMLLLILFMQLMVIKLECPGFSTWLRVELRSLQTKSWRLKEESNFMPASAMLTKTLASWKVLPSNLRSSMYSEFSKVLKTSTTSYFCAKHLKMCSDNCCPSAPPWKTSAHSTCPNYCHTLKSPAMWTCSTKCSWLTTTET